MYKKRTKAAFSMTRQNTYWKLTWENNLIKSFLGFKIIFCIHWLWSKGEKKNLCKKIEETLFNFFKYERNRFFYASLKEHVSLTVLESDTLCSGVMGRDIAITYVDHKQGSRKRGMADFFHFRETLRARRWLSQDFLFSSFACLIYFIQIKESACMHRYACLPAD